LTKLHDVAWAQAKTTSLQLTANHNPTQARINRELWPDGVIFTGSQLQGRLTPRPKIFTNTKLNAISVHKKAI